MALNKVPPYTSLSDKQYISIDGPDGIVNNFQYDLQTRALYSRNSQVLQLSHHGSTHISEDPIPLATCNNQGLLSADDKCKLDALLQTRIGVLGFQGAGFPSDGGWMSGDIILAAGTDFISLERIGNVVRFTVDSTTPLVCNCESCTEIFWIQDETDTTSLRPPACSGKLPGVNSYGELKVYLFPESTIVGKTNSSAVLQNKGNYPALIFKRYDDSISPGTAELEVVLKRNSINKTTTEIGWAFTPGASGKVQNVFYMGTNANGEPIEFAFDPSMEAGLLGSLLYNGNNITKKPAVITNYTSTILGTNLYKVKNWNMNNNLAIGTEYEAKNVWQYINPENPTTGLNSQSLTYDSTIDLLPIGTLVDIWSFKVGESAGAPILRHFFTCRPHINPNNIWTSLDQIQFGDLSITREESQADNLSYDKSSYAQVSAIRNLSTSNWGIRGYDDPLLGFDLIDSGTDTADLSKQHRAVIDTSLPGLVVNSDTSATDPYSERPIMVWNRSNLNNSYVKLDIGCPTSSKFTPFDILLRSKIDEYNDKYMFVSEKGEIGGMYYVKVEGVHFTDLPQFGSVRSLFPSANKNKIFNYTRKLMFSNLLDGGLTTSLVSYNGNSVILAGDSPYEGDVGDIIELLHQEYNSLCVRTEFTVDELSGLINLQFKVGILDMSVPYEDDDVNDIDDFVRGLAPGYAVSAVYSQLNSYTGVGARPSSSPDSFVVYDGGYQVGGSKSEYWNSLEIMLRDNQLWIWWNKLLIPPSTNLSAALNTPVSVNSVYFPVDINDNDKFGKVGLRLWPGATVRRCEVLSQNKQLSEYQYGQLTIS